MSDAVMLMTPEEAGETVPGWPSDMWLATIPTGRGRIRIEAIQGERIASRLDATAPGIPVAPEHPGLPRAELTFEQELALVSAVQRHGPAALAAIRERDRRRIGSPAEAQQRTGSIRVMDCGQAVSGAATIWMLAGTLCGFVSGCGVVLFLLSA